MKLLMLILSALFLSMLLIVPTIAKTPRERASESLGYLLFEFLPPPGCQVYSSCINRDRDNTAYNAADTSFYSSHISFPLLEI